MWCNNNTSTTFAGIRKNWAASLTGLTTVTNQSRANSGAMVKIVDVVPLLMQNIAGAIDKEKNFVRLQGLIGTAALVRDRQYVLSGSRCGPMVAAPRTSRTSAPTTGSPPHCTD